MTFIPASPGWYYRYDPEGDPESVDPILAWQEIDGHLHPVVPSGGGFAPKAIIMKTGEMDEDASDVAYLPTLHVK